jgi:hypothetical protein
LTITQSDMNPGDALRRARRATRRDDALPYGSAGTALKPGGGRLAQRESASFTPRRSLVRSQYRPPM